MCAMLNQDTSKYPGEQKINGYISPDTWMWGKACKQGEDYMAMSHPTTCKDYAVDMRYRHSHLFDANNWKESDIVSNCYYISVPNQETVDRMLQNLNDWLHPYEKQHRFKRTTLTKVELVDAEVDHLYIIEGSDMWARNTTALSFYLSFIRIMSFYTKEQWEGVMKGNYPGGYGKCNEIDYVRSYMNQFGRDFYQYMWDHPRLLTVKPTEQQFVTLYTKPITVGHGASGLFYFGQAERAPAASLPASLQQHPIWRLMQKYKTEGFPHD